MWATAKTFWLSLMALAVWLAALDALALAEPPMLGLGSAGDAQTNEGHSVSADGRYVVFSSFATNLVANDTNGVQDVFLWDTVANTVTLVSSSAADMPANGDSSLAVISADGAWIAFRSVADNLTADTNGTIADIFLYSRLATTIELVSVSAAGEQSLAAANNPDINANGRFVTFDTTADLAAGAGTDVQNVFRRDVWRNTTELVSRTPAGVAGNDASFDAQMSADGERIVFVSMASDLVALPTVGKDSFLYDVALEQTTLLSLNDQGNAGDGTSYFPTISGDGKVAAFHSFADNLASNDAQGRADVFLRDLQTGSLEVISVTPSGAPADGDSIHPALDYTGDRIAYITFAGNLLADTTRERGDAVLFDRATRTTTLLSKADDGAGGNSDSASPALSLDGATQVLLSRANNLSPNGTAFGDVLLAAIPANAPAQPLLAAAVLPSSRSTAIGSPLTAFASVIGTEVVSGCKVELDSEQNIDFSYHLTDPGSNLVVGSSNQQFLLLPGVAQSLIVALQPNSALVEEELSFLVSCDSSIAPVVPGTNTLLVSAESVQPPDLVALVATIDNDGIVKLPSDGGAGVFSVASINLGSTADINVRPVVRGMPLDEFTICQTNAVTGACLAPPSELVSIVINNGDTSTFGFFAASSTAIPFAPAVNRLFVQFEDGAGVVRGRVSVAVLTVAE